MHLYTYDPAPNPKRVGYVLKYKGISLPTTQIDLTKAEQFSEEFIALNNGCTVPVLKLDDSNVLCSALSIAQYIDSQYAEKPLFGRNAVESAQVTDWVGRIMFDGFIPIADMLRNYGKSFENRAVPGRVKTPQIPALIERGKVRLDAFWMTMDEHLAGKEFVVTDVPTMADIDLYCVCEFSNWVKEKVPESASNLQRWMHNFKAVLEGSAH
jgi:glutathione S-transferase